MKKRVITLVFILIIISCSLLPIVLGDALTPLDVDCTASTTDHGKTVVTVTGEPANLMILINDSEVPLVDRVTIPAEATAFSSGDTLFARTGDTVHVWQKSANPLIATSYGEYHVAIDDIKSVDTLSIALSAEGEFGQTKIAVSGYAGKPRILINRTSMTWDACTPIFDNNSYNLPTDTAVLGDGGLSAQTTENVNVGDYVHVWTGNDDMSTLLSYSERQITVSDIALMTDPINVIVEPERIFGDNITLNFTDGLSGFYYMYYIVEEGSTLGFPEPLSATDLMVNVKNVIDSDDAPLDDTFIYGNFQTESLTNNLYGIIGYVSESIKASTNYTLYVCLSKSGITVANNNFFTTTFSTNAIVDASGLETYFEFIDDDMSDDKTVFHQLKAIPAGHRFAYKNTNDHPGAVKKGELITNSGIWTTVEDDQSLQIVHDTSLGVAELNNNKQVIKYAIKQSVAEVESANPIPGGLSFENDPNSDDKTKVIVEDAEAMHKYIYKIIDVDSQPVIRPDEEATGWIGWLDLPVDRLIQTTHGTSIFVVTVVIVDQKIYAISASNGTAVVAVNSPLINGLTFTDDDNNSDSTLIQLGASSVPEHVFLYKISDDLEAVSAPFEGTELVGWQVVSDGNSIATTHGKHIGVAEAKLEGGIYIPVHFSDNTAVVEDDILPELSNALSFSDDSTNNDQTVLTLAGSVDSKIIYYRSYTGLDVGLAAPLLGSFIPNADTDWKPLNGNTLAFVTGHGTRIGVAELELIDTKYYFKKYSEGSAVVQNSIVPELINGLSLIKNGTSTSSTKVVLGDKSHNSNSFVYKLSVTRPSVDEILLDWQPVSHDDVINVTAGQVVGIAEIDNTNKVIQFSSQSAVVYTPAPPVDDPEEETPAQEIKPEKPIADTLKDLSKSLDGVSTPEQAKKAMDSIGSAFNSIDLNKLDTGGRKEVLEYMNKLLDGAGDLIEKMGSDSDRGQAVEDIIRSTKKIIDNMNKSQDASSKQDQLDLNKKFVEVAKKAIRAEGKVLLKGDSPKISLEQLTDALKKSKALNDKLSKALKDSGMIQDLDEIKVTLLISGDMSAKGKSDIEIDEAALALLAEAVDDIILEFGQTSIRIDKADLVNAKGNLKFSNEDSKALIGGIQRTVREINAFRGVDKIKAFDNPVKVVFHVDDFGLEDATLEELSSLIVMVQNEETGAWEPNGGFYDPMTRTISLYRIHMSKYTLIKNDKKFLDIDTSDAKETINNMLGKGIINPSDNFKPNDYITRDEFTSWICRAYGLKVSHEENVFKDVSESNPYSNDIANAYKHGLVVGRSEFVFDPKEYIIKEEMATLIANAMIKYSDVKTSQNGLSLYGNTMNKNGISTWAIDNVILSLDLGIMDLDENGNFSPNDFVTKEEAARIFSKLYK